MTPTIVVTFLTALVFDFINGFHDAANSIATVVSTGVLKPRIAVVWAAFWNFAAVFSFGVTVAMMVGKGVVHTELVTVPVILSGLVGAIIWNLLTWYLGIPSSSSHALIGGYVGASLVFGGWSLLVWEGLLKVMFFIVVAPIIGLVLGVINQMIVYRLVPPSGSPRKITLVFKRLQLISSAIYSFSHGTNDAQKTMGILFALLVAAKQLDVHAPMPLQIIFLCYSMIAMGTLFGGYRIVRTMGTKLTKLAPMQGFCAETGGGVTILAVSALGIPVSTTQTITGAIVGVGMTHGIQSVRWLVAGQILWAWVLTIPCSALFAAIFYFLVGRWLPIL